MSYLMIFNDYPLIFLCSHYRLQYKKALSKLPFYFHFKNVNNQWIVAQTKVFFLRSLKSFLFINLGEVKEKRFQLFEPDGRVLESPGASLGFIKKCFRASEK